jgi:hypothetical protein
MNMRRLMLVGIKKESESRLPHDYRHGIMLPCLWKGSKPSGYLKLIADLSCVALAKQEAQRSMVLGEKIIATPRVSGSPREKPAQPSRLRPPADWRSQIVMPKEDTNRELARKIESLESRVDEQFNVIFDAIRQLIAGTPESNPPPHGQDARDTSPQKNPTVNRVLRDLAPLRENQRHPRGFAPDLRLVLRSLGEAGSAAQHGSLREHFPRA